MTTLNFTKYLLSIGLLAVSSLTIAQQTEIEYNSDFGAAGPQLLIQESGDSGSMTGEDGWARIWFKNNNDPNNRWGLLARPQLNATDNLGNLLSPLVFAYSGAQKFGFGRDGTLKINNQYSLPNVDGSNGQVLTTDGAGSVTWVDNPKIITQVISSQDLHPAEFAAHYRNQSQFSYFTSVPTNPVGYYSLPVPVGGKLLKVSMIASHNDSGQNPYPGIKLRLFKNQTSTSPLASLLGSVNTSHTGFINFAKFDLNVTTNNLLSTDQCFFIQIFSDNGSGIGFPGTWPDNDFKISKIIVEYEMP
jgi:hypothetical protein